MTLHTILPWLLIGVLMSTMAMVFGVSRDDASFTMLSAACFAAFIIVIALATNLPYWRGGNGSMDAGNDPAAEQASLASPAVDLARRNAKLFATCYVWGGTALLAIYSLTQLEWRHGWQYALGMLALSAVCLAFALQLNKPAGARSNKLMMLAYRLTATQGLLTAAGLVYLIYTGKLMTSRSDWAANYVFLFGGIAILLLSAIAMRSSRLLFESSLRGKT